MYVPHACIWKRHHEITFSILLARKLAAGVAHVFILSNNFGCFWHLSEYSKVNSSIRFWGTLTARMPSRGGPLAFHFSFCFTSIHRMLSPAAREEKKVRKAYRQAKTPTDTITGLICKRISSYLCMHLCTYVCVHALAHRRGGRLNRKLTVIGNLLLQCKEL